MGLEPYIPALAGLIAVVVTLAGLAAMGLGAAYVVSEAIQGNRLAAALTAIFVGWVLFGASTRALEP